MTHVIGLVDAHRVAAGARARAEPNSLPKEPGQGKQVTEHKVVNDYNAKKVLFSYFGYSETQHRRCRCPRRAGVHGTARLSLFRCTSVPLSIAESIHTTRTKCNPAIHTTRS